jgi:hypothetical protein
MQTIDQIVAGIFQENSIAVISKGRLVKECFKLMCACEEVNMDLFHVKPDHWRFAKIPPEQRKAMEQESLRRKAAEEQAEKARITKDARSAELSLSVKEKEQG